MFIQVIFSFMSNYYGGETEWPSDTMNDLSNVELYDMQWVDNSFNQVLENGINGDDPNGITQETQQAYNAANNMLQDLYTTRFLLGRSFRRKL